MSWSRIIAAVVMLPIMHMTWVGCGGDTSSHSGSSVEDRVGQQADDAARGAAIFGAITQPPPRATPATPGKRTLLYLGNSADDDDRGGWFNETQGLANGDPAVGDPFWYLSKNIDSNKNTYIYRVSYSEHLAHNFHYDRRRIRMPGPTSRDICSHVGDIDYHVYKGQGYIAAAYEDCGDARGRIAFFRASSIDGSEELLYPISVLDVGANQPKAPWVAIRNDGRVYSSCGGSLCKTPGQIFEYTVSWDKIAAHEARLTPSASRTIHLTDAAGSKDIEMVNRQGADFSADGRLFYISASEDVLVPNVFVRGRQVYSRRHDIFVFDSGPDGYRWGLVDRSSKSSLPFKFQSGGVGQEPEGVSFFDTSTVADYHPQMPRGELHVQLLNNEVFTDDNLWIKHYVRICDKDNVYTPIGHADYCAECGPCGLNEGDCDGDAQCRAPLKCVANVGAAYGWPSWVDVCQLP